MTPVGWYILVGLVLISMGLLASRIRRMPMTTAVFYLFVGVLIGPSVFGVFHFNPLKQSAWMEVITEIAVLISLYTSGLKLQLPIRATIWRVPLRLATVSMLVGIALVALFAHYVLGFEIGAAILIGAILAPTDPVLATDVQVKHPGDRDRLRFSLTGEAGLNDGTAFPFVVLGLGLLGLHDIGENGSRWLLVDVLWACSAGIGIGVLLGWGLARIVFALRKRQRETVFMDDFLSLGLIAVANGVALSVSAYAFLAVFAAAVALRQTEQKQVAAQTGADDEASAEEALMSNRSLEFNEQIERISEVLLILLLGGSLFIDSWTWEAVAVAAFVFFVARPLAVYVGLFGAAINSQAKAYTAWFGVRGIGSLYYLMYSIQHGLPEPIALRILSITLIVVTLSILVHGISVTPLMDRYRARRLRSRGV